MEGLARRAMAVWRRLTHFLRASTFDRELDEEIALHIELRADELQQDGMTRGEAMARARREFGSPLRVKEETRAACEIYARRHRLVADTLNTLGWSIKPPRATFYVWAPVPDGYDSIGFAGHVLDQVGVNITPGVGFGAHGEGYFRLSVTAPDSRLEEAMTRLRKLKL